MVNLSSNPVIGKLLYKRFEGKLDENISERLRLTKPLQDRNLMLYKCLSNKHKQQFDGILAYFSEQLGLQMQVPDEFIMKEGDDDDDCSLYMIILGECWVEVGRCSSF